MRGPLSLAPRNDVFASAVVRSARSTSGLALLPERVLPSCTLAFPSDGFPSEGNTTRVTGAILEQPVEVYLLQ